MSRVKFWVALSFKNPKLGCEEMSVLVERLCDCDDHIENISSQMDIEHIHLYPHLTEMACFIDHQSGYLTTNQPCVSWFATNDPTLSKKLTSAKNELARIDVDYTNLGKDINLSHLQLELATEAQEAFKRHHEDTPGNKGKAKKKSSQNNTGKKGKAKNRSLYR
ncbi:hypothetical protein BJ138DRAFT_1105937 [Hygrophoropsis aurantiaca]|uniref:Uncharacterized protein n=1 Tax=Hygrophoropsis aurantiaca TaxID=72124 RepID=A0ACB7ZXJ2_9AGAM|nr:hypothetical protein BJ138DRAFT_1105937 [Hygrophoropsis aurantiaca]